MKKTALKRTFKWGERHLPDPNPTLSVDQVKGVYAAQYPEITSATIEGPSYRDNREVYTFTRAVGTKG